MRDHCEVKNACRAKFDKSISRAIVKIREFEAQNLKELQEQGFLEPDESHFIYIDKLSIITEKLQEEIFQQFFNFQILNYLQSKHNSKMAGSQSDRDRKKDKKSKIPEEMKLKNVLYFKKIKKYIESKHSNSLFTSIMKNMVDKKYENIKHDCQVRIQNFLFSLIFFRLKSKTF